jgi:glycosyltransferase involved in cell wall biosynthesis
MPRILILCEYPTLLGGERSMLATLPAIIADGFEVLVAAPPAGPLADELRRRGIRNCDWHTDFFGAARPSLERLREDLDAVIRDTQPRLVHANSLSCSRIAGPVVRELAVPSIGHMRDIMKISTQAVLDLNAHSRLIAVSRATRDFHVAQGVDPVKCRVVMNGIDLIEFRPRAPTNYLHEELHLPDASRLVAVIGQLGLRKGTDVALAAASEMSGMYPDVHWLVVGGRTSNKAESVEFGHTLKAMAEKAPLAGRVHFLGVRHDVAHILSECELLVHPARQEPLGRVLIEAAACAVAAVATDVGGTREIFPDESHAAVLVPPDNSFAIAEAVTSLLADETRRKELGENARRRAESGFDIRTAAANLIAQFSMS